MTNLGQPRGEVPRQVLLGGAQVSIRATLELPESATDDQVRDAMCEAGVCLMYDAYEPETWSRALERIRHASDAECVDCTADKLDALVSELSEREKIPYTDALRHVGRRFPSLYRKSMQAANMVAPESCRGERHRGQGLAPTGYGEFKSFENTGLKPEQSADGVIDLDKVAAQLAKERGDSYATPERRLEGLTAELAKIGTVYSLDACREAIARALHEQQLKVDADRVERDAKAFEKLVLEHMQANPSLAYSEASRELARKHPNLYLRAMNGRPN